MPRRYLRYRKLCRPAQPLSDPVRGGSRVATHVTARSPCDHVSAVGYSTYSCTELSVTESGAYVASSGSHLFWYASIADWPGKSPSGISSTAKTSPACCWSQPTVSTVSTRVSPGISLRQSPTFTSVAVTVPLLLMKKRMPATIINSTKTPTPRPMINPHRVFFGGAPYWPSGGTSPYGNGGGGGGYAPGGGVGYALGGGGGYAPGGGGGYAPGCGA